MKRYRLDRRAVESFFVQLIWFRRRQIEEEYLGAIEITITKDGSTMKHSDGNMKKVVWE